MTIKIIVDLGAIRRNLVALKKKTQNKTLLMVKADAYGHGAEAVAHATENFCDMLGVATVEEGINLRRLGIKKDILVAVAEPNELEIAAQNRLTVGVSNCGQLKELAALSRTGSVPDIHLKLDTGMHRLGFEHDELDCVINLLKASNIEPSGIYSHLRATNDAQLSAFENMSGKIMENFPSAVRHLASSCSIDRRDMLYDMTRIGLLAYKNAMTVLSEVIAVRYVKRGEYLGYGDFRAERDLRTAIVLGGYADGVQRESPSSAIIRGRRCKSIGRVCMDMFTVDTGNFFAEPGEVAILQDTEFTAEKVAEERNTIEYSVITGWRGRAQRIYFDDENTSEKSGEREDK